MCTPLNQTVASSSSCRVTTPHSAQTTRGIGARRTRGIEHRQGCVSVSSIDIQTHSRHLVSSGADAPTRHREARAARRFTRFTLLSCSCVSHSVLGRLAVAAWHVSSSFRVAGAAGALAAEWCDGTDVVQVTAQTNAAFPLPFQPPASSIGEWPA